MLNFEYTPEFEKDLKILKKRWRSLPADVTSVETALAVVYSGDDEIYRQFFAGGRATVITKTADSEVVKMRIDCKSLGNDKKTRLIFIAIRTGSSVKFIELYSKSDKDREDQSRIKKILSEATYDDKRRTI